MGRSTAKTARSLPNRNSFRSAVSPSTSSPILPRWPPCAGTEHGPSTDVEREGLGAFPHLPSNQNLDNSLLLKRGANTYLKAADTTAHHRRNLIARIDRNDIDCVRARNFGIAHCGYRTDDP